jgi:hypothetical protein
MTNVHAKEWPPMDNEKLQHVLAKWIINHQRPFIIVEDPELVEAFQTCHPDANPGKRDAMKTYIMGLYDDVKKKLKVLYLIFNMC